MSVRINLLCYRNIIPVQVCQLGDVFHGVPRHASRITTEVSLFTAASHVWTGPRGSRWFAQTTGVISPMVSSPHLAMHETIRKFIPTFQEASCFQQPNTCHHLPALTTPLLPYTITCRQPSIGFAPGDDFNLRNVVYVCRVVNSALVHILT